MTISRSKSSVESLDRRFYPKVGPNWDDTLLFRQAMEWSGNAQRLLDLGAGAGIVRQLDLRSLKGTIHGCDLDPRVATNPLIHYGCRADAEALPYRAEVFDAVVADNVFEHLAHPERVFTEVFRVLRTGGLFHFKTPNRRHYVPTIARLTPHWIHERVTAMRQRTGADTFETYYRVNTAEAVRQLAHASGFEVVECRLIESRPEYCRINPALYLCGIAYERFVNSSELFASFRVIVLGTLRKPGRATRPIN